MELEINIFGVNKRWSGSTHPKGTQTPNDRFGTIGCNFVLLACWLDALRRDVYAIRDFGYGAINNLSEYSMGSIDLVSPGSFNNLSGDGSRRRMFVVSFPMDGRW